VSLGSLSLAGDDIFDIDFGGDRCLKRTPSFPDPYMGVGLPPISSGAPDAPFYADIAGV
jgi:hypothetical protein